MSPSGRWSSLYLRLALRALVNPRLAVDLLRLMWSFRARVVSAAALPAPPSPRVHALAHVHRLRRRSCRPTGQRRRPVRALAPPSDGSMKHKDVERRRQGSASRNTVEVKRRAIELGFDAVGIATLERNAHAAELDRWLAAGYAGTMTYLHRQAEKRKHPARIMPEARVAVVTLTNYFHGHTDPGREPGERGGRVAQYAWSADYHRVLQAPRA